MKRLSLWSALAASLWFALGCPDPNTKPPPGGTPDSGTPDSGTPDSGTPDAGLVIPLERAHAGGDPQSLALVDGRAYITIGDHLEIWDVSQPDAPALVGQTEPGGVMLGSVAALGDRAYVVERLDLESVIRIWDVSNPAAPKSVKTFRAVESGQGTSVMHEVSIANGKLYVADQEQGIWIFPLTDKDAPGTPELIPLAGVTRAIPSGDKLYYANEGFIGFWFGILDAKADYAEVGGASVPGGKDAVMVGDVLVAISTDGILAYQFDANDPWTANEIYRFSDAFSRKLLGDGQHVYVPAFDGLHVLDVSTPSAIVHAGPFKDIQTVEGDALAVVNGVLTTATKRGLLVNVDVSAPLQPVQKAAVPITVCTNCSSVTSTPDGTLYIADVASGLRTAKLSTLDALGRGTVADAPMVAMEDVAVSDGYAFLSDWFYGLRVFDVTTPAQPKLVGSLVTGGFASTVVADGTKVVVGESTNGGALRVVDAWNRAEPQLLGSAPTSKARDLVMRGDQVFVADETIFDPGGLRLFDIHDPANIQLLGYYDGCGNAVSVALAGDVALLACGSDGFHLVDVSLPSNLTARATLPLQNGSANAVAVDGHIAYLGTHDRVMAYDLTDPANPVKLTEWKVAYPVRGLTVPFSGRVVAACGAAGMYQWELK